MPPSDFSNIIPRTDIKILAESDESESVREIREIYADYLGVNNSLFSLNIPKCMHSMTWAPDALYRTVDGLISVLLSLKLRPVIRFRQGSEMAQQLGKLVYEKMTKESTLFEFRVQEGAPPPLLLILDRRDDPVTPLLNQWTYQAMVHELLGIRNNLVDLGNVEAAPKDMKEVVMSSEQDEFYKRVRIVFQSLPILLLTESLPFRTCSRTLERSAPPSKLSWTSSRRRARTRRRWRALRT